ncbi:DNA (cytosine-5-)-methyltransferase [Mucilaginibacter psychrotolerans]|uniref:DNA (cytosine-5-)-methyltransferase n=1 Tax=Mucilaginibacter psychrotolerans TaxID=1524096 RepID=UPI00195A33CE|nr:DNA (cytosine-5-)-methyltransferase [Mucilaginibacter psychrotolerans]
MPGLFHRQPRQRRRAQRKKGALWWEIHRIIAGKNRSGKPIKYLCFENVDRLLIFPSHEKGRDFASILASLSDLGYAVEWRIINAAEYGFPQKRKRVFILAYHKSTEMYRSLKRCPDMTDWIARDGVLAKAFPVIPNGAANNFSIDGSAKNIRWDKRYKFGHARMFEKIGVMIDRQVTTLKVAVDYNGPYTLLHDIMLDGALVDESFYIDEAAIPKWQQLKGARRIERKRGDGGKGYMYCMGAVPFPDPADRPARTIITHEGGTFACRIKHAIACSGRLRRLHPIELERLNMFPDGHTEGVTDPQRAFLMGNALVVGVVERIGRCLAAVIR